MFRFRLPDAFRDPMFRPERTCHVVFDRDVFQRVRDEDLGQVRRQPIRSVLAGFGEPVTDWEGGTVRMLLGREQFTEPAVADLHGPRRLRVADGRV